MKTFVKENESSDNCIFELMNIKQGVVLSNKSSLNNIIYEEIGYSVEQLTDILVIISRNQIIIDR